MLDTPPVNVYKIGAVGIIELALPQKFNSLPMAAYQAIEAAIDEYEQADSGVRTVLIQAEGKHFCTGADLDEANKFRQHRDEIANFIHYGHHVLKRIENMKLPVVAACQGLALAGGGELTLVCDVVFAATTFRFGDQHAEYGLIPGWGGSQRLPRRIGLRRSLDLFYSARQIDAKTALDWGLVNYVVEPEELTEAALSYCTKLSARSRRGITAMKSLASQGLEGSLESGLQAEAEAAIEMMLSDDVSEGLAAFVERRAPVFTS